MIKNSYHKVNTIGWNYIISIKTKKNNTINYVKKKSDHCLPAWKIKLSITNVNYIHRWCFLLECTHKKLLKVKRNVMSDINVKDLFF